MSYLEYKDSGVEWIGMIPKDWKMWKIIHACPYVSSGTTPSSQTTEYYGGNTLWVTTGELRETEIFDTKKKVTQMALEKFPTLKIYPVGSVAIAMYGATIGRLGILGKEATTNQACCVMPPSKKLFNKYLYYWLYATRQEIINLSSGGGQPNVNQEKIASLRVSAPNFEEQKQIAAVLDRETAAIDTLIAKQERLIALLQEKRQAVISHAVTKGLNPDVEMKESGVEWLGQVPKHWAVKRSKFLFSFVTSGSRGWAQYYSDDGELFFRISNLTRDSIETKNSNLRYVTPPKGSEGERSRIKKGDILISITADLGSVGVADSFFEGGYVSQHVSLARPNAKVGSPRWLGYCLISDMAKEQFLSSGYGGTKVQLSLEDVREISVSYPPINEQVEIEKFIDTQLKKFEKLILKSQLATKLLKERRTALISAAVTGKIDLRNA